MEATTLRDSTVMGMINEWFNACIIDAESDSLIVVGDSAIDCYTATRDIYHVAGYPTTIFFNHDGTRSQTIKGYYDRDSYIRVLYRMYLVFKDE